MPRATLTTGGRDGRPGVLRERPAATNGSDVVRPPREDWGGQAGVNPHASHQGEAIDCSNCHGVHEIVVYVLQRVPRLRGARRLGGAPGEGVRQGGKATMDVRFRQQGRNAGRAVLAALAHGTFRLSGAGIRRLGVEGGGERRAAGACALDDPWARQRAGRPAARRPQDALARRRVHGHGQRAWRASMTVTLLVRGQPHHRASETAQEGESQSRRRLRGHPRRGVREHDRRGAGLGHRRGVGRHHHDRRHPPGRRGRPRAGAGLGRG